MIPWSTSFNFEESLCVCIEPNYKFTSNTFSILMPHGKFMQLNVVEDSISVIFDWYSYINEKVADSLQLNTNSKSTLFEERIKNSFKFSFVTKTFVEIALNTLNS